MITLFLGIKQGHRAGFYPCIASSTVAPSSGFEPDTFGLTLQRSTHELRGQCAPENNQTIRGDSSEFAKRTQAILKQKLTN